MAELLLPADPQSAFITELTAELPGHGFEGPVGSKIPTDRPAEFLVIAAVGGTGRDLVTDSPTVTAEAYATTEKRARDMCAYAVAVAQAAARAGTLGGAVCYRLGVFSLPANLPNPLVPDRYRYTATLSADLRRSAV